MKDTYRFLAFDLGAESGRLVLGTVANGRMDLEVIHRFRTEGLVMLGVRQWDLARIYEEMVAGLAEAVQRFGPHYDGIGVDTWGVDFGLLDKDGQPLANPVHYRDHRTEGMFDKAFAKVPKAEIYAATGIQFLPFNTLYQLLSLVDRERPILPVAESLLLMGDLLGYLLSGVKSCEYTNASTTQLLDARTRSWHDGLAERLAIPRKLLLEPTPPGTILGPVLPEIAARTGLDPTTPVIAPATHDTASAVAAVPVTTSDEAWAYLSSGTWSLLGAELPEPCITEGSLAEDFTNEGGVANTIRFLKNIFGLWLVQECRRSWERAGDSLDYGTLTEEAAACEPFQAIIDLSDPRLFAPDDMPSLIQTLCQESKQPAPQSRSAIIRCALESLALKYRQTLHSLDTLLERKTAHLHIIGGGVQNKLLCQMTADACGIPVLAGPIEATAMGNIGVQAMAVGAVPDLAAMRAVVATSSETIRYTPQNTEAWNEAAAAFDTRYQRKGT